MRYLNTIENNEEDELDNEDEELADNNVAYDDIDLDILSDLTGTINFIRI